MTVDTPLVEDFSDDSGQFTRYDAYNAAQRSALLAQKHRDIRSFAPVITRPLTVFDLDQRAMTDMEVAMSQLEATTNVFGEIWTSPFGGISVSSDSSVVGWPTLRGSLQLGPNIYESRAPSQPVDLITDFADTDLISCALPNFPLASVTLSSSYIAFSSSANGSFADITYTSSLGLPASLTTLIAGNSEATWTRATLVANGGVHFDASNVTGVQIGITATASPVITFAALRLLASTWTYLPIDIDTRTKRLRRSVSRTGSTVTSYSAQNPIVFRSSDPPSEADPRPVDSSNSLAFYTGARTVTGTSTVALYFRELGLDENQQLDLSTIFTQDDLNNYGTRAQTISGVPLWRSSPIPGRPVQPDFGTALYSSRTQSSLDSIAQVSLDADTQFLLERTQDSVSSAYLEVKLTWTQAGVGTLTIKNQDGTGQTFSTPTLTSLTNYALIATVSESSARAVIVTLDPTRSRITGTFFDTTLINDASLVHRRKGRLGWYVSLLDGDAYVDGVRPLETNFSEYLSLPFYSDTPATGAQITSHYSPPLELATGAGASQWGGIVRADSSHSKSGYAYRVEDDHTHHLQGLQTNFMYLDNLANAEIEFDLFMPSSHPTITAFLYSSPGALIPLTVQPVSSNSWHFVRIELKDLEGQILPGLFSLVLLTSTGEPWYLDNLSCRTRIVSWDGRGRQIDAWGMNEDEWLPFRDAINNPTSGLVFTQRGTSMQVRARALRSSATISDITVQPKYAGLGNFAWADQRSTPLGALPTPVVSTSHVGRTYAYSSASTVLGSEPVVAFLWTFGDGSTDMGPSASHTYTSAGTYVVTLTAVTLYDRVAIATTSLVVT